MDAALADGEVAAAELRERYRAIGREQVDDQTDQQPDQLSLDMADGTGPDPGEPPPQP